MYSYYDPVLDSTLSSQSVVEAYILLMSPVKSMWDGGDRGKGRGGASRRYVSFVCVYNMYES